MIDWQTGKPPRAGRYRVQDASIRCDCCWISAQYRKGQFMHIRWGAWEVLVVTRWAEE